MGTTKNVAIITGASKGLGRALTLAFAEKGYDLAICARNGETLNHVREEAEQFGTEILAVTADVSKSNDVERFVSLVDYHLGQVDVLINNASALGPSPIPQLADFPEEAFQSVLTANIMNPFLMTQRVLPMMFRRDKGSIINVTSEAGNTGYAGWGVYGVSKFAVEGLTETWAAELKQAGIRVNMVDPGEMDTEMHALAVPDCDYPLASPKEVTDVFMYLASDVSKTVTGERFEAQSWKDVEAYGS